MSWPTVDDTVGWAILEAFAPLLAENPKTAALSLRVARRFVARQVSVTVDVAATLAARAKWRLFDEAIVGRFNEPVPLYRVFDETELKHIVSSGRITGGSYSVAPERAHGASWGYNIDHIVDLGNNQRGKRLGQHIYIAKIDGFDETFLHLSPGIEFDPQGPPEQPAKMDPERCNPGLGCSILIKAADAEGFFKVDPSGQIHKMSLADLRKEAEEFASKDDPKEEAPAQPSEDFRDPEWGLKPKDKFIVTKGSKGVGVEIRSPGIVKDVRQRKGEREVLVTLWFSYPRKFPDGRWTRDNLTLYVTHPNRLSDREVPLLDARGSRILIRKR